MVPAVRRYRLEVVLYPTTIKIPHPKRAKPDVKAPEPGGGICLHNYAKDFMDDNLIQQALNAQPQVPPAEWMMVGFTCTVGEIDMGGQKMKAMVFYHASNPNGVRFIFPMNDQGARNIANELLGRPHIVVPDIDYTPKANGSAT